MFFFLSKTLNYLTQPLVIISIMLVLSWVLNRKRWKVRLFKGALVLLLFFSNDFISNEIISRWELPATPYSQLNKTYPLGIVLTGVTRGNMLPDDRVYFTRGADRVIHAVQLYKLGKIKKILVSGGNGGLSERSRQEADELVDAFILMGVPKEALLIENQSRNTRESAVAVKTMLSDDYAPTDCLLITSAYHMRRSRACFNKVGLPIDTFSTDFLHHNRKYSFDVLFIPKLDSINIWTILTREWTGMLAYKLNGYI